MNKKNATITYLIGNMIVFYLFPLFIQDTTSAMMVLLVAIPLSCFMISYFYGSKHGFVWFYFIAVAVLFIPTIYIFYNETAWIYTIIYGVIALVGNLIGKIVSKNR